MWATKNLLVNGISIFVSVKVLKNYTIKRDENFLKSYLIS